MRSALLLLSTLAVASACSESPTQPGPQELDPQFHLGEGKGAGDDDGDDGIRIKANGKGIQRPLFGNPFTSLNYSFEVELEDGETVGEISLRGDGPDGIFAEAEGTITCVAVAADGVTARVGWVVTESESNVPGPDPTGQEGVFTVVAGKHGTAQSTFIFTSAAFPGLAQFHCDGGIPAASLGGLVDVSAKIKVKVKS